MPRLPISGDDDGTWGNILNDYLSVELDSSGNLRRAADITNALSTAQSAQIDLTAHTQATTSVHGITDTSNIVYKNELMCNVKDFGAIGDGTNDDTSAIQAAINAGGITFFPAGKYVHSGLTVKDNTQLIGVGSSNNNYGFPPHNSETISWLTLKNGSDTHSITGPPRSVQDSSNVKISGLLIDGNKDNQTVAGHGIYIQESATGEEAMWLIENCWVYGTKGKGIYIGQNRRAVTIFKTLVTRSEDIGIHVGSSDCTLFKALVGFAGNNDPDAGVGDPLEVKPAIKISDWVTRLIGCDAWRSKVGVLVDANVAAIEIIGCGFDRHNEHGIYISAGVRGVSIIGNRLGINSQEADDLYDHIHVAGPNDRTVTITGNQFTHLEPGITNRVQNAIFAEVGANVMGSGNIFVSDSAFASGRVNEKSRFPDLAIPATQTITLHSRETTISNIPAGVQEFGGVNSFRTKIDITFADEVRLIAVVKTGFLGNSGSNIRLQYSTDDGVNWDYFDGISGPNVGIGVAGLRDSGWITVPVDARADVQLRLVTASGDAAADPVIGTVQAQFR